MAYFICTSGGSGKGNTVVVTCASEFAGETITLAKTGKTYTKTCPSSSPYTVTFYGVESGTYTVCCTLDGQTYSETVIVQDISAVLNYGLNWQTWVDTAQYLDSSDYSTLADVLADEEAVRELFTEHACVDYMAPIATADENIEAIINNDLCAKWINLSDYALDTLYANAAIADVMDTADKYGYGEWALMPQVPTMTSATAPYGTVEASSTDSSTTAWKAFDGDDSTGWFPTSGSTNNYISYAFTSATKVSAVKVIVQVGASAPSRTLIAQGYNGSSWVDLGSQTISAGTGSARTETFNITVENTTSFEKCRVFCAETLFSSGQWSISIRTLQFYAYAPKGNVPVMTSNTAPYGTASATSVYGTGNEAYLAFNGSPIGGWASGNGQSTNQRLQYNFTLPVCAKRISLRARNPHDESACRIKNYKIEASNDGSTWTTLYTGVYSSPFDSAPKRINIDNNNYYLYYSILIVDNYTAYSCGVDILQFYGRELKVSVPAMTSNTAPYGVASASDIYPYQTSYAWYVFDGNDTTRWISDGREQISNKYIQYEFQSKIAVQQISILANYESGHLALKNFTLQGSDDGTTFEDIYTGQTVDENRKQVFSFTNNKAYKIWRLFCADVWANYVSIYTLQFYGLDYSEKEFEVGTTKKWLYDHGVELETISTGTSGDSTISRKDSDMLYLEIPAATNRYAYVSSPLVDISSYSLYRCKVDGVLYLSSTSASTGYGLLAIFSQTPNLNGTGRDAMSEFGINAASTNIPNNLSLGISSITGDKYVTIEQKNVSGTIAKKCTITELWLE